MIIAAVTIGTVVGVLLILGLKRSKRLQHLQEQLADWRRGGQYWGIRVSADGKNSACEVSRRLSGHVFPIDSAPRLPLPGCERRHCNCRYLPYPERRRGERRRTIRRSAVRFEGSKPERRSGDDRRNAVQAWKQERN